MIGQEAGRLNRLVSDLLDLARLGADDFRLDIVDVDLTALVAESAQVWHARCAAAGVAFAVEAPAHPVPVRTDPRRLRQVVDGLAENALRVTPAGAPIVLALRHVPGAARAGGARRRPGTVRGGLPAGVRAGGAALAVRRGAAGGDGDRAGAGARAGDPDGRARSKPGPAAEGGARFTVTLPLATAGPERRNR